MEPVIVDEAGSILEGKCEGRLCLRDGGPGMARTVFRDHERFLRTYFQAHPGLYFTGVVDGLIRERRNAAQATG